MAAATCKPESALLSRQPRWVREYVHILWIIEGNRTLRAHGGVCFFYTDGAFQAMRNFPPQATFRRVKEPQRQRTTKQLSHVGRKFPPAPDVLAPVFLIGRRSTRRLRCHDMALGSAVGVQSHRQTAALACRRKQMEPLDLGDTAGAIVL